MKIAVLDAALAYASHGWPVLPVDGKRPVLPNWPAAASTDPHVIRGWWKRLPDANVGIVTGPRSGLAVLDVDPRSGGTESLAELVEERVGVLPGTVQSLTGGNGLHFVYAYPGIPLKSRAHSLGPGLDIKADGGMIVAPPSVHPETGRRYEWFGGVWDHGVAPWPTEQLRAATEPHPVPVPRPVPLRPAVDRSQAVRRVEGLLNTLFATPEGKRNTIVYWVACRLGEMVAAGEITETAAVDLLYTAGRQAGQSHRELVAGGNGGTIFSELRAGQRTAVAA